MDAFYQSNETAQQICVFKARIWANTTLEKSHVDLSLFVNYYWRISRSSFNRLFMTELFVLFYWFLFIIKYLFLWNLVFDPFWKQEDGNAFPRRPEGPKTKLECWRVQTISCTSFMVMLIRCIRSFTHITQSTQPTPLETINRIYILDLSCVINRFLVRYHLKLCIIVFRQFWNRPLIFASNNL